MKMSRVFAAIAGAVLSVGASASPMVIAQRGASGYLPEHTLEAYTLAFAQGADMIELGVSMTKDGELICLHDTRLERMTDVEAKFPDRVTSNGRYYLADFTLEEIRTLRINGADEDLVGYTIPTLAESLALIQRLNASLGASQGREVGVLVEIKDPRGHEERRLPITASILDTLTAAGYTTPQDKAMIQCFELKELKRARSFGCQLRLICMIADGTIPNDFRMAEWSKTVDAISPSRESLEFNDGAILELAKKYDMPIYAYNFVDPDAAAIASSMRLGIAGVITSYPDKGREAVSLLQANDQDAPNTTDDTAHEKPQPEAGADDKSDDKG